MILVNYNRKRELLHSSTTLLLATTVGSLGLSVPASAQLGLVVGVPCAETAVAAPNGGYQTFTSGAACTATAICLAPGTKYGVFARAYSALSCPADTVANNAFDGADSAGLGRVTANASGVDLDNFLLRGEGVAFDTCAGPSFARDVSYPDVCGMPQTIAGGGGPGDPGNPPPGVSCYYGFSGDPGVSLPGDPTCNV